MNLKVLFVAIAVLVAAAAQADALEDGLQGWLEDDAASETASSPLPVFVAGIDSGGAGNELQPGPNCKLVVLCVNDSHCRQIYPGFWACAWMENSACDSIWCESGE